MFLLAIYAVNTGTNKAVVMTAAATCGVAIAAVAVNEGSTMATAAGVATALPAVLAFAAPATPVPPVTLSAKMVKKPQTTTVIKPSNIPEKPARYIVSRLIPQPNPKAKKGIITIPAFVRKERISESKLPNIIPTTKGKITPTNVMNGIDAIPADPKAIMVKNGPSLTESIAMAPTSSFDPNSAVKAVYNPPLVFEMAEMNARDDIPQRPLSPKK